MKRGPIKDHVVIRLADEGVPVAAVARALQRPSDELMVIINDAIAEGFLVSAPAFDWPPNSRRDMREPVMAPLRFSDLASLAAKLQVAFELAPAESRFLAALMVRGEVARPTLHAIVSGDDPPTAPKIVDIYAHKVRQRVMAKLSGFEIKTVYGRGYALSGAMRNEVRRYVESQDNTASLQPEGEGLECRGSMGLTTLTGAS